MLLRVENIESWCIIEKQKLIGWKSTLWLDKINWLISIGKYWLTRWYQLIWLDDLTCLIICVQTKTLWEDMLNKSSSFADFVRFCPHTYARTQQSLPPLWAAIKLNILSKCEQSRKYSTSFSWEVAFCSSVRYASSIVFLNLIWQVSKVQSHLAFILRKSQGGF